jgi:predicted glycogen debranching enzyme
MRRPDPAPESLDAFDAFDAAAGLEWLETNGLGGWASSTVSGAHTRRYHGLLVAATRPPLGRVVLLSKLDETVRIGGEAFDLASNRFPGVIHPRGYQHLLAFEREMFPVFRYRIGTATIEKMVAAIHGENTTLVRYLLGAASPPCTIEFRPLVAGRDYHALRRADGPGPAFTVAKGVLATEPLAGGARLFVSVPGAIFERGPDWWYRFEYDRERERGFDYQEDLWTPGLLRTALQPGQALHVLVSTDDPAGRDPSSLLERERARRTDLLGRLPLRDRATASLAMAADQFLVRRGTGLGTAIAGYHWFGDWGRDTLIALPGLTLATGRPDDARHVLQTFAGLFDQGMLPNRFPDDGDAPEYNSVDAALWYFVALHAYLAATGDRAFVRALLPPLREAVRWHQEGTRHGIRVDHDGLLRAGEPGVALTWMDAKVDGRAVTPRIGKAVDINALWVNALTILAEFELELGDTSAAAHLSADAARARRQFSRVFWHAEGGCLYDVVDGDTRDASIRPNQILALSLPHPLLSVRQRRQVLRTVEEKLLTPVGLRTLSPDDPAYRPRYEGDAPARDSAYHQGTVWAWLLGPYVTALVRERGRRGRAQGRELLTRALDHLREAGVGTCSEIFDAEPPHAPRGTIAQAWSVAEILRAWILCVAEPAVTAED